jgi:ABC-type multidrug transport system fused ATPase/permease subunit
MQNIQVLSSKVDLGLDLWLGAWSLQSIAVYVLLSISFILGLLFAILIFHPRRPEIRQELRLLKNKSALLQQELSTLQHESSQELQQRLEQASPQAQQSQALAAQDPRSLKVSIWSHVALLGILGLFILLTVLYFYTDNKLQQLSQELSTEQEKTQKLEESLQQKTARLSSRNQELEQELGGQKEQIQELRRIPQQTRDYLTGFHLRNYIHEIKQLEQEAETEQDRKSLQQAREALKAALTHYQDQESKDLSRNSENNPKEGSETQLNTSAFQDPDNFEQK